MLEKDCSFIRYLFSVSNRGFIAANVSMLLDLMSVASLL